MNKHRRSVAGAGFTLIEILLVVVIIAVASAVAVPMFARSFRGAKLRASTRLVLTMHRNAQSKAVLGQRYMAILFDERKGTLEIGGSGPAGAEDRIRFSRASAAARRRRWATVMTGAEAPEATPGAGALARKLEEGVKITSFRGGQEIDDLYFVNYYPNGMCEAYEIELGDDENRTARIKVDAGDGEGEGGA